jgi:hypothetical protein
MPDADDRVSAGPATSDSANVAPIVMPIAPSRVRFVARQIR